MNPGRTGGVSWHFCLQWGGKVFLALTMYMQVWICVCMCMCVCVHIHSVSFPLLLCKIVCVGRFWILTFSDLLSSLHIAKTSYLGREHWCMWYKSHPKASLSWKFKEAECQLRIELLALLSAFLSLSFIRRIWISSVLIPHFFLKLGRGLQLLTLCPFKLWNGFWSLCNSNSWL